MQRHRPRNVILGAVTAGLAAGVVVVLADLDSITAGAQVTTDTVSASVGSSPTGQSLRPSFLGVSLEYNQVQAYTGRNARKINPVLIRLVQNLAPRRIPVVRIGGNSADFTWWPMRGERRPPGAQYALTKGWLQTTGALASALGARMILGVNLAGGSPAVAVAEARALLGGIGRRHIQAFEIGNEPDVYGQFPWYTQQGHAVYARSRDYTLSDFIAQFSQWRAALGRRTPVAGPAFAELNWLSGVNTFIDSERGLKVLTLHRYPLRACLTDPSAQGYPTIPGLLADAASTGVAQAVAPYVGAAHGRRVPFRVDEMNSASCTGKPGVSNTFASALWVLDTLFNLASVGVDGVNIHSLPGAAYELFSFKRKGRAWWAFVHPEYYGMLLFTEAFPTGARLLPVTVSPSGPLKVWATRAPNGTTRVVLIDKDPSTAYQVQVRVSGFAGPAQLERLEAPTDSSTGGVTLGGRSFGAQTSTGNLPGPQAEKVFPASGTYTVTVEPASAAVLTPSLGSGGAAG